MDLFTDKYPEYTVKGTGFQDKAKAKKTIEMMKNRDITYQFQVINTMYNRGLQVIKRTKDVQKKKQLKEATKEFKKWLDNYKKKNRKTEIWHYLPVDIVQKMTKLAEHYNISRKARGLEKSVKSDKGFVQIWKQVKGNPKALRTIPVKASIPDGETWDKHRNNYCNRRHSMIKGAKKYPLFHEDGLLKGLPTVMHTNMIMWACSPEPKKVIKLSKKIDVRLKQIKKSIKNSKK
jgi:hypothetical protein